MPILSPLPPESPEELLKLVEKLNNPKRLTKAERANLIREKGCSTLRLEQKKLQRLEKLPKHREAQKRYLSSLDELPMAVLTARAR